MGPVGCPEVSPSYQSTLHNIPVERRSLFTAVEARNHTHFPG